MIRRILFYALCLVTLVVSYGVGTIVKPLFGM